MKLFFCLTLWVLTVSLPAQTYRVVRTEGKITKNSVPLKAGDTLNINQRIEFSAPSDRMVLLAGKSFWISKPAAGSMQTAVSEASLSPFVHSIPATRQKEEEIVSLRSYFGDSIFTFTSSHFKLKIAPEDSISEHQFYVLRYRYNGRIFSKKISENSSLLDFDKRVLLTTKKYGVIPSDSVKYVEIFRYDIERRRFTKVNAFAVRWAGVEIRQEIKLVKGILKANGIPESEYSETLTYYIKGIYGKTDEFFLKNMIEKTN